MAKVEDMKTLLTLYFRQLKRNFKKMELFGKLYLLGCLWVFEAGLCFAVLSSDTVSQVMNLLAPLLVAVIPMLFFLPDVIYRFFMTHEETAMDAFLRTRPMKEETWERFLWLSQLLHPENLMLPAMVLPIAFIIMPLGWGLCLLLCLYLVSVFDAIVVMEARRGGPYLEGNRRQSHAGEGWLERLLTRLNLRFMHDAVFGIQSRSLMRSRRLQISILVLFVWFAFYGYFMNFTGDAGDVMALDFFFFFTIMLPAMTLAQYGLGIEANFFSGLWTRPVALRRILDDKFRFYTVITLLDSLIYLPACFMGMFHWCVLIGAVLLTVGFCNVFMLWPCFHCEPFDLMGKAFFNQQGTRSSFNIKVFALIFGSMFLHMVPVLLLPPMWYMVVQLIICVISLYFRPRFFNHLVRDFEKHRYKYMERYK